MAVGHASDHEAETGCTVVLGPFRAAVDVRGLASGTRQLDSLSPSHVIPEVDALLLTGGSAYGLAAADGVASWLEERGRGFATSAAKVAIVPTAVIFDLGRGRADRRPDAEMGHAACEAASDAPVKEGRVGVGSGASVGKLLGPGGAMPSGVASWGGRCGSYTVGALAVVNAFGDVVNGRGEIIAGARGQGGAFIDTASYLRENDPPAEFGRQAGTNTSLAIVATDCPLSRADLVAVARQAMNAIVRRTSPANTYFDGDLVFAVSTGENARALDPANVLRVGLCAEWALERAIERAVAPPPTGEVPGPAPD